MIRKLVVLSLACVGFASAQVEPSLNLNSPELKTYVYIHPVFLAVTAAIKTLPLMVYVTIENPLAPGSALVVQPAVMYGSVILTDALLHTYTVDVAAFQGSVGYRIYLGQKNAGLYLQPSAILGYESMKFASSESSASASGVVGSLMGYFGYAGHGDIGFFVDLGVGYNVSGVTVKDDQGNSFDLQSSGRAFDVNLGVGLPF